MKGILKAFHSSNSSNTSEMRRLNVGGMNRPQKCPAQMKKVAPPVVPDTAAAHAILQPSTGQVPTYRHSGSSFGSVGYSSSGEDSCFAPDTVIAKEEYETSGNGLDCYGMPGRSPNSQFNYPTTTFQYPVQPCGQYAQIHGKSAVYYHHHHHHHHHHHLALQEDQGIDLTQSPGRDSPGSSGSGSGSGSRHSTTSVDSGRASSCHPGHRSSISSSVGSADHNIPIKVDRLLAQGVPDQDVLHAWLLDLHFEEYFPLFLAAGYDMRTVVRMTPEDLTAIGIKKPNHRKKLKSEISALNVSDGIPDYIPGSLKEWLEILRLEDYKDALASQNYETIEDVLQLTWEDLEDIGIVKLGHQKRIIIAIKRVKDLKAGKTFPRSKVKVEAPCSCRTLANNSCGCYNYDCQNVPKDSQTDVQYRTDVVPIKIRTVRGKSLESLKEGVTNMGGISSFSGNVSLPHQPISCRYRSYDDGDITPTNESASAAPYEGGGTLPRPRGLVRPRPVAKISATFCPAYRNEELICDADLKKKPPSPPKRQSETITVVADLHLPPEPAPGTPPWSLEDRHLMKSLRAQDSSFMSSTSSNESDSIPFANDNAGTIKQRIRSHSDYSSSPFKTTHNSYSMNSKKESVGVLDHIGDMLATLTDELDAMLEEEKRQGLNDDD